VLYEDVGSGSDSLQKRDSVCGPEVNRDRALVAIDVEEHGGHPATTVAEMTDVVAALGGLDFDYIGALVREDHRRPGTGQHGGGIEDPVAIQRSEHRAPPAVIEAERACVSRFDK